MFVMFLWFVKDKDTLLYRMSPKEEIIYGVLYFGSAVLIASGFLSYFM
jgi:hypothetical protein